MPKDTRLEPQAKQGFVSGEKEDVFVTAPVQIASGRMSGTALAKC